MLVAELEQEVEAVEEVACIYQQQLVQNVALAVLLPALCRV